MLEHPAASHPANPEDPVARTQGGLRQRHRPDRSRRQCRVEISSAFSGGHSLRDRSDGDRVDDKLFTAANRGKYISVVALGVYLGLTI